VTSHFLLHHLHRIGSGSFGTVYRVRGKLDGIGYAIKKSRRRPHSQHERTSMMSEVHALAALSASTATQYEDDISSDKTNSIVRYYSAWIEESDQTLCIQMELCESSAADALHFTHQTAYQLLRDILNALDLLHSNDFVHLDIKPANILVKKNRFKLADFGLALHTTNGKFNGNVEEGDSRYLSFSLSLSLSPCSLSLFSHSSLSFASPLSLSGMLCRLLCVVLCRYMAKELLNWGQISDLTKCDLFSLGISGTSLCPLTPPTLPPHFTSLTLFFSVFELYSRQSLEPNGDHWHALRDGIIDFPLPLNTASASASPTEQQQEQEQQEHLISLITQLMSPDPKDRPSAQHCLEHFIELKTPLEIELERQRMKAMRLEQELQQLIQKKLRIGSS
jgi:serine/threonine protein kinase